MLCYVQQFHICVQHSAIFVLKTPYLCQKGHICDKKVVCLGAIFCRKVFVQSLLLLSQFTEFVSIWVNLRIHSYDTIYICKLAPSALEYQEIPCGARLLLCSSGPNKVVFLFLLSDAKVVNVLFPSDARLDVWIVTKKPFEILYP